MRGTLWVYVNNRLVDDYPCEDRQKAEQITRAFDFDGCRMLHGIWQSPMSGQTYPIIIR